MNIRRSGITILVLVFFTMILLTACSGNKPAEVTTPDETANDVSTTEETVEETVATETESGSGVSEETQSEETTAPEKDNNDSGSENQQSTEEKTKEPEKQPEKAQGTETKPAQDAEKSDEKVAEETSQKSGSTFEQPVLLTSSGQSADVQMVKVLLDRANIKYVINPTVKAEEVKDVKTLILAVGGSSKGLGAAGINAEQEMERTLGVISKAKELNLKIITVHIGGEARRGELSDKFINACVPKSDYVIVVAEGNKDNLFTKLTKDNNIPMDVVNKITDAVEPLKKVFE